MLNQKEYEILNHIIKTIYGGKSSAGMRRRALSDLKKLIHFRFSVFSLGILRNKKVYLTDSIVNSDFEKDFEDEFLYLSETQLRCPITHPGFFRYRSPLCIKIPRLLTMNSGKSPLIIKTIC